MSDDLASIQRETRLRMIGALLMVAFGVGGLLWIALRGLPSFLGGESVSAGATVSDVRVVDAAGKVHRFADYQGQVLVVDVWATWCGPCRMSLPEVAALQKTSDGRYKVIALSVDDGGFDQVTPFLRAHPDMGLEAVVPESHSAIQALGTIRGIPTTFIVDRQGRVLTRWSGYAPGRAEEELKKALRR